MKSNLLLRIRERLLKQSRSHSIFSIPIITLLIYVMLGVFFGFLINIMLFKNVDNVNLKDQASSKYDRHLVDHAERGKIKDRDGNILARDTEAYQIAVIVGQDFDNHIEDANEVAKALSEIIDMEEKEILKVINDGIEKGLYQVEFGDKGRNVDYKGKQKIEEQEL